MTKIEHLKQEVREMAMEHYPPRKDPSFYYRKQGDYILGANAAITAKIVGRDIPLSMIRNTEAYRKGFDDVSRYLDYVLEDVRNRIEKI